MTDAQVGALERIGLRHGVYASSDSNGWWSFGSAETGRWYGSYETKGEALRAGLLAADLDRRQAKAADWLKGTVWDERGFERMELQGGGVRLSPEMTQRFR